MPSCLIDISHNSPPPLTVTTPVRSSPLFNWAVMDNVALPFPLDGEQMIQLQSGDDAVHSQLAVMFTVCFCSADVNTRLLADDFMLLPSFLQDALNATSRTGNMNFSDLIIVQYK